MYKGNVIFLCGAGSAEVFGQVETILRDRYGWTVLNPLTIPQELEAESVLALRMAMIREADAVALIKGFEEADHCRIEAGYAQMTGKRLIDLEQAYNIKFQQEEKPEEAQEEQPDEEQPDEEQQEGGNE